MYFKLQKAHERFTESPEEIHGMRVIRVSDKAVEAEMSLCFQYDASTKLFNLSIKRLNNGSAPRYDLLTQAKPNTVWHIVIKSEKGRKLLSAELTNTQGQQRIAAMPYHEGSVVSLQSILPVAIDEPTAQADEQPQKEYGPLKTFIRMWHEFRDKKKKVSKARKTTAL